MKESNYWEIAMLVVIGILSVLMVRSMQLGLVDMVAQWLGILFSFLLALTLSESAKIDSEEKRAELIMEDLVEELRFIQAELDKSGPAKFYLATWSYIKGTGLPDRIPHPLRKAFAQAFVTVDAYNDSADNLKNYINMPKIGQDRTNELEEIYFDTQKKLEKATLEALTFYESMK